MPTIFHISNNHPPLSPPLTPAKLEDPGSREQAAEYRCRLYDLAHKALDRDAPESCSICLEAIEPLKPTPEPSSGPAATWAAPTFAAANGTHGGPHEGAAAANGAATGSANGIANGGREVGEGAAVANGHDGVAALARGAEGKGGEGEKQQGSNAYKAHRLIVLACLHCYHHGCFEEWSSRNENASCPACKQPVPLF